MEKPLFEYKNRLRNILAIIYWILVSLSSILVLLNSNLIKNTISIIIFGIVVTVILYPIKRIKTSVHVDAIVFNEKGLHPLNRNEFGVAFENIYEYKLKSIAFGLNWIVLKRRNGKTIRKLSSLTGKELRELSEILTERINKVNS
uniref:hypothetical protein n=1 Tax=uncultured Draconibacterium sp. TaxID=1573823 RepID=UPI003216F439